MDKAEMVFEKIAGPMNLIRRTRRWVAEKVEGVLKRKRPKATLKPIGVKTTPRQQMMKEYDKNYKTWTDGKRPVSPPDRNKLRKAMVSDAYMKKVFK